MKKRVITRDTLIDNASGDFSRLNAGILGLGRPEGYDGFGRKVPDVTETRPKTRREVLEARLNKTEMRFYDEILAHADGEDYIVLSQEVRLPLEGGGVYIPDFVVILKRPSEFRTWPLATRLTLPMRLYMAYPEVTEVKGGYRGPGWEQGHERYKRAAAQYSAFMRFRLVTYDRKTGKWNVERWNDGE